MAVIEAVFITPVFFALVFGIIEIGLAMNDKLALANTVRAGTRVASAAGAETWADYGILQSIQRESAALPRSNIKLIVVYKASGFGSEPTLDCRNGVASADCNVYYPSDFSKPKTAFGCVTTETLDRYWCPTTRKVSLAGTGPDFVGVWMKIEHPWVTKMFGNTQTLTDRSVIQLEPRVRS